MAKAIIPAGRPISGKLIPRFSVVRTIVGVTLLAAGRYLLQGARRAAPPVPIMLEPQRRRRTFSPGYSWAHDPIHHRIEYDL